MASCNGCGKPMPSGQSGRLCALCIAKMVGYAHGDYHDDSDPAVKLFQRKLDEQRSPKAAPGGCAVVVLAAAAVPALLAAAGIVVARL